MLRSSPVVSCDGPLRLLLPSVRSRVKVWNSGTFLRWAASARLCENEHARYARQDPFAVPLCEAPHERANATAASERPALHLRSQRHLQYDAKVQRWEHAMAYYMDQRLFNICAFTLAWAQTFDVGNDPELTAQDRRSR